MKKKHIKTLGLKKVTITNLQSSRIEGGVQNNYTRANCERSQPASICHCHTVISD
ncbi:hypothetical protein ACFO3O_10610 [Dokdonia ponticola]|uniref:Natural product n=1 Tax=Dokdonia ponticola TaxID=2041041 RepID=A0ABV9HY20_9FLAO